MQTFSKTKTLQSLVFHIEKNISENHLYENISCKDIYSVPLLSCTHQNLTKPPVNYTNKTSIASELDMHIIEVLRTLSNI